MFGATIIFDDRCLEPGKERLFPFSRHRSARIKKKLIKRHGSEFRQVPTLYRAGNRIIAHPVLKAQLQAVATLMPTPVTL